MNIKIFKSYLSEIADSNNIERDVNNFIKNKKNVNITQTMCPKIDKNGETHVYFTVITVMYEE